ncbi:nuclear transport factor 2 family protein [Phenylobacterium sp.]|uniref:nuclear transport factor 2 family protein n=1 Tax=Phenylobacterium sp. TaxID=1871053 RepID=UPI003D28725F
MRRILIALVAALVTPAAAAPSARAVVEAKFAAVNRHAVADVVALYAPDAVVTASDFCAPRRGRDDVRRTYEAIIGGVPDVVADVQEMIVEGDRVAVKFVVRSRIAGRAFDVPILDLFTVRDGLIVRDDGIFDNRGCACTP